MAPVASQSILLEIIGITMFMFLTIVHMATTKERNGADMMGVKAVVMVKVMVKVMTGVMTGIKSL